MKFNETQFFVFIASVIVGLLIAMNISFKALPTVNLSALQYKNAIDEKNNLYSEISDLNKQYENNYNKLKQYAESTSNSKIRQDMEKELKYNNMILGFEGAQGPGIQIILNDAPDNNSSDVEDEFTKWGRIVHNTDIMEVINSLRLAGAEGISINGVRILTNSEVYCWGSFLKINNDVINAPFDINAIGDGDAIRQYLTGDEGYLTFLKYRDISISVTLSQNLKLPAYVGGNSLKYLKETKNN